MRQLTLTQLRQLEWQTVEAPTLTTSASAIVRPIAAATCDFDHLAVAGATGLPLPMAIGHECIAVIVETGSDVKRFQPGDTVIVPFQIHCGQCAPCRAGHTSSCAMLPFLSCYGLGRAAGDWGGAASDLLAVPYADAMLVALPPEVDPLDAVALGCNLPDAYRCVDALLQWPGAPVLVVGGAFGNIALYAVLIAQALGASRVDVVDRDPDRRAAAAALGANVIEAPGDVAPGAYPVTVDASMDEQLLDLAIRATAPSGTVTVSTMYASNAVTLPLLTMFERCLTLRTGQPHARALIEPVLDLIVAGSLRPSRITTDVVAWDGADRAFSRGTGKIVCVRE